MEKQKTTTTTTTTRMEVKKSLKMLEYVWDVLVQGSGCCPNDINDRDSMYDYLDITIHILNNQSASEYDVEWTNMVVQECDEHQEKKENRKHLQQHHQDKDNGKQLEEQHHYMSSREEFRGRLVNLLLPMDHLCVGETIPYLESLLWLVLKECLQFFFYMQQRCSVFSDYVVQLFADKQTEIMSVESYLECIGFGGIASLVKKDNEKRMYEMKEYKRFVEFVTSIPIK
jgi:hypothetical protein